MGVVLLGSDVDYCLEVICSLAFLVFVFVWFGGGLVWAFGFAVFDEYWVMWVFCYRAISGWGARDGLYLLLFGFCVKPE